MCESACKHVTKKGHFNKKIVIGIFDYKMLNISITVQFCDSKSHHNVPLNEDNDAHALTVSFSMS